MCNNLSNTTGATCKAGSAYPSGAPEITPSFWWGSCCLVFSVLCCVMSEADLGGDRAPLFWEKLVAYIGNHWRITRAGPLLGSQWAPSYGNFWIHLCMCTIICLFIFGHGVVSLFSIDEFDYPSGIFFPLFIW